METNGKEKDYFKKLNEAKNFLSREQKFNYEQEQHSLLEETDKRVSKIKDSLSLAKTLLTIIVDFTKTDRGFIMRIDENKMLEFVAGKDNRGNDLKQEDFKISISVAKEAIEGDKEIFIGNALNTEKYTPTKSIRDLKLQTIICSPIRKNNKIIGVLYVDSSFPDFKFSDKDLKVFRAFAEHISRYM